MTFFDELQARGLIHQVAEHEEMPLSKLLETPQTVYAGFDPTASSLHAGNLIPLFGLKRFQEAGHRVIVLAGGATGMVGDPSGKSAERNLLDREALQRNVAAIKTQMERLLDLSDPAKGIMVDNLDWTQEVTYLEFLRDIGKHFTINTMLRKDSVKGRLDREGEGISYTEFSYMLLQAFDFYHLFKEHGCAIQIGGSDQWGNITAGTDLVRRKLGKKAYGATFPLLMNADGSKFGKTAKGAVFLDPAITSPFAFRQYWFQTADADVITRLKYFTFLSLEEIAALEAAGYPAPQKKLAEVMTELVHGAEEAKKVEKAVEVFFNPKADLREMPAEYLEDAFEGAPLVELPRAQFNGEGTTWFDLVVAVVPDDKGKPLSKSKARRLIEQNSLALNGEKLKAGEARINSERFIHDRYLVLRKGKKSPYLVKVVE